MIKIILGAVIAVVATLYYIKNREKVNNFIKSIIAKIKN